MIRKLLPILILLVAFASIVVMKAIVPATARTAPPERVARVGVATVTAQDTPAVVHVTGSVEAARQVTIVPEVAGRIVQQSPELVPGGRLAEGDVMVRIDPRDYRLAVEQERSRVRQAELELELELGRREVARAEWAAVGKDAADEQSLALRGPQLATTERSLESAKAGLARAELALERSVLRAPFNAIVTIEAAEVGQVVGATSQVATLVGTDQVFVRAAVPMDRVPFIAIPGLGGDEASSATVIQNLGGTTVERPATVLRLVGTLDPQSRTAQVMLGVEAPLDSPAGAPPLLPGAYVDIRIQGRTVSQVVPVPRAAVVDGDRVWVVTPENTLEPRTLEVQWRDSEHLFARAGVAGDERVVISPLALPVAGMSVEVIDR